MDLTKLKSIDSRNASVIFVCMNAILQKKFLWFQPGTAFKLKEHKDKKDFEIFVCEDKDHEGKEFWLSKGFVLGEFDKDYTPICWSKDLFFVF